MFQNLSECPYGCIFHKDILRGDCRTPWADDCKLNKQDIENLKKKKGE